VLEAARHWAAGVYAEHAQVLRVGCFGSYARGDAGVGSDLDMVVVVADAFRERAGTQLDASRLPVPVDVLVYSESEWQALQRSGGRFAGTLARETVWFMKS
jgi:predicted nucleotidyltransferase